MAAVAASIAVEVPLEYSVQEIGYDGTEIRQNPPSMSESLAKLASKIDFTGLEEGEEDNSLLAPTESTTSGTKKGEKDEDGPVQAPQWQWESVRSKLKNALAEASVLLDVLNVCREKKYMVFDPVAQDPPPKRPIVHMLAKKKALGNAAEILIRGADRMKLCQTDSARTRGIPNFHLELLRLRQNWRLKKVANNIIGDLSYASSGSRFWQPGVFEVSKTDDADGVVTTVTNGPGPVRASPALKVTIPPDLEYESYVEVIIQKDLETVMSAQVTVPSTGGPASNLLDSTGGSDIPWHKKLEAGQNTLFCKELFATLTREALGLASSVPHTIVGNQITATLFPSIQLIIALRQVPLTDSGSQNGASASQPFLRKPDHNHVLEHSLHQLLWDVHYRQKHQPMPHPSTGPLGFTAKRRNAGPTAASRSSLLALAKHESLLDQIIRQARHVVLRLRTMYVIDTLAKEIKDPLIVAHWNALNSPYVSQVKINITSSGYEALTRTSVVITVHENSLKTICRDGRMMTLSIEPQELRDLLLCQIAQHQTLAIQSLAKCHGWISVSNSFFLGLGAMEPLGNPSSCLLSSPKGGYNLIAVKCAPQRGIQVAVAATAAKKTITSDSSSEEDDDTEDLPEVSKFDFDFDNDDPMMGFSDLNFAKIGNGPAKRALLFDDDGKTKKKRRKKKKVDPDGCVKDKKQKTVWFKDLRYGPMQEIWLERMEGRNCLNRLEMMMALLGPGPSTRSGSDV